MVDLPIFFLKKIDLTQQRRGYKETMEKNK